MTLVQRAVFNTKTVVVAVVVAVVVVVVVTFVHIDVVCHVTAFMLCRTRLLRVNVVTASFCLVQELRNCCYTQCHSHRPNDAATMGAVGVQTPLKFRLGCPTPAEFWSTL